MAPYFSLHPSFPTTRDDFSPLTLWEIHRVSISREHSCSELRRRAPISGSLAVRSCPQGAWNENNFSKWKGGYWCCSSITAEETFQGLNFSDTLHPPGEFASCFQCDGISDLLHSSLCTWSGCRAQLLEHRKGLREEFSPLMWQQLNLKRCICTLGKEYPARRTVIGQMLNCWKRTGLANVGQTQQRGDQNAIARPVKRLQGTGKPSFSRWLSFPLGMRGRNGGQLFQAHSGGPECVGPKGLPAPAPVELTRPGLQQTPVSGSVLASAFTPSGGRGGGRRRREPVRSPRGLCLGAGEEERHSCYTTTQVLTQEVEQNPSLALPVPPALTSPTPTHTLDTLTRLHTSLSSWESDRLATDSSRAADPWGHDGPGTPSRPKAAGEGDQGPLVKVPRATSAKSPGRRSDTAAGKDSLASEEGPYCCRSPSPSWNLSAEQKPSFSHKLRSNIRPCEKFLPLEQCFPSVPCAPELPSHPGRFWFNRPQVGSKSLHVKRALSLLT